MPRRSGWRGPRALYVGLAGIALFVVGLTAAFVSVWRRAPGGGPTPVRPNTAVGDSTCLSCHRDKATYESTAHRLTMRLPSATAIRGSFRDGENVLRTPDPDVYFLMHADASGFYQTAVVGRAPDTSSHTERIAYVAGSGRRGQSFLYWSDGQLFQLPVSYWATVGTWMGSPGKVHVDPRASFGRTIAPRCFECHATWMQVVPDPAATNRFDSTGAILGITCERCHASGREHVARARSVARSVRDPAIVNPARLPRERLMEACAQCHGGIGVPQTLPFTYVAGKPLERYLHLIRGAPDEPVDVHGNQATALMRSACYQGSQMTCLTCHDPHKTERDPVALSGRCMTCHQEQSCGLFRTQGHAIAGKCVDCHMPVQASSRVVTDDLSRTASRAEGRSHWIRVYRDSLSRSASDVRR
jgi:hypothetical protein